MDHVSYDEILNNIDNVLNKELSDVDLYILKCHLFIEREFIAFIERKTEGEVKGFSFDVLRRLVVQIYNGFELDKSLIWAERMERFVTFLNKVRASLAHNFTYNESDLVETIKIANEMNGGGWNPERIETPHVGMFDRVLARISFTLNLRSGRSVYHGEHPDVVAKRRAEQKERIEALLNKKTASDNNPGATR